MSRRRYSNARCGRSRKGLRRRAAPKSRKPCSAPDAPVYQDYLLELLSENRWADAFAVLERSRARTLLQMLAERDFESKDVPDELDVERRKNAADYDRVQEEVAGLSPARDKPAIAALQARLLELTAERANIIGKIKRGSVRYAELHYPSPLDLEGARAALDPQTALVSYAVTPRQTLLFVVWPKGSPRAISVFAIPVTEAALREKVRSFREAIGARTFASQTLAAQKGRALYDLLLRPAESALIPAKRLLIVPDGPLDGLPFAALRRSANQWLIEWKPLHSALSVTHYGELKRSRRPDASYHVALAAFGDASYAANSESPATSPTAVSGELRGSLNPSELRPLRFSRAEVEQIAALYPERAELYLGQEATEAHAKSLGTDVKYIHFAVHGLLDRDFPLNSALVLARPAEPEKSQENGLLQAWELCAGVRWDADLAVLSACQSGVGQEFAGEGMFGLARAVGDCDAVERRRSSDSVIDDGSVPAVARGPLKGRSFTDSAARAARNASLGVSVLLGGLRAVRRLAVVRKQRGCRTRRGGRRELCARFILITGPLHGRGKDRATVSGLAVNIAARRSPARADCGHSYSSSLGRGPERYSAGSPVSTSAPAMSHRRSGGPKPKARFVDPDHHLRHSRYVAQSDDMQPATIVWEW